MTRVKPRDVTSVETELAEAADRQLELLGVVPESLLTMAHRPRMAALFAELASEVMAKGTVNRGLKQLVGYMASVAAGCRYCQAHTAHNADRQGVAAAKLRQVFEYSTSPLFSEAERAALDLAKAAAQVPNEVTDESVDRLHQWFSDEQIVEIVAVIALFGWLNRWNDTMATTLEVAPRDWAMHRLEELGWKVGKHA